jgi:hypothetical protein
VYDPALTAPFGSGLTRDLFRQFDSQIEYGPDANRQVRLEQGALFRDVDRFGIPTWARGSPNAETQGKSQAVTTAATTLDNVIFTAQSWFSVASRRVAGRESS